MKLTAFQKGILFAIFTAIGNLFVSTGIPVTLIGYMASGIIILANVGIYLYKNYYKPSASVQGTTSIYDAVWGVVLAIANFLVTAATNALLKQVINWPDLIHGAITVGVLYFFSKFATGSALPQQPAN